MLKTLQVDHLRNLNQFFFQPKPRMNFIHGANGSGKTSILEAIHYLSRARSFRQTSFKKLLTWEEDSVWIRGILEEGDEIAIEKSRSGQTKIKINQTFCHSIAQLTEHLPVLVIHPESHGLIQDHASLRRQCLDWGVFHAYPCFFQHFKACRMALLHRQALLNTLASQPSVHYLRQWDQAWAKDGEALDGYRKRYFGSFYAYFQPMVKKWLPWPVDLQYDRGWPEDQTLLEALTQGLAGDQRAGWTRFGPHRADLKFLVHHRLAKDCLSRGQQKLLVFALKLAQAAAFRDYTQKSCLYLIDDLNSELDKQKQATLIEDLSLAKAQIFITALDAQSYSAAVDSSLDAVFYLEDGHLTQQS